MRGSLMPGDSTVLLTNGRVLSFEEVEEAFRKSKEANQIISIQRSPGDLLIASLEKEIFLLRLLDRIFTNERSS